MTNSLLVKITLILGVAALLISPTQWAVQLPGNIHLAPADPLLGLAFAGLLLHAFRHRKWYILKPPPVLLLLFLFWTLISLAAAENRMAALKEFIQYSEYFLAGFILFRSFPEMRFDRRHLFYVLAGMTSFAILAALIQYFIPAIPNTGVSGGYGNQNVYGGFLSLMLPVLYGAVLDNQHRRIIRGGFCLIITAGLVTILNGGTCIAVVAGFGLVSLGKSQRAFVAFAVVVILLTIFVYPRLPRHNPQAWYETIALYENTGEPAQRYPEWQAATNMALDNPLFGVGAGHYQRHIGSYYGIVPNRPEASPPDSQNLYLVLAASIGFPGMLFFIGALGWFMATALSTNRDPGFAGTAMGLAGGLFAFALNALWAPLLVRGIGLMLTAVMVLSVLYKQKTDK